MAALQPTWGEVFQVPPATTGDDLLRLPHDGSRYELYEGVLVREMTSAGHGGVCQRLGGELYVYARTTGFPNPIVQNTLFDLTPAGIPKRTVLAPDLAILRPGTALPWDVVTHAIPLLAVEVVSESQTLAELALKAQTYRQAGVEAVWIIDHQTHGVEVWAAQGQSMLNETQTLTSPLLPDFSISVRFLLNG